MFLLPAVVVLVLVLLATATATVTDLSVANFTSYLQQFDDEAHHVIEFYAHWCPHCRHFAPTFEQIAEFFELHPEDAPVLVSRADCANEVRTRRM
jgi:thiol oxidase